MDARVHIFVATRRCKTANPNRPGLHYPLPPPPHSQKAPVFILQAAKWSPGPVWIWTWAIQPLNKLLAVWATWHMTELDLFWMYVPWAQKWTYYLYATRESLRSIKNYCGWYVQWVSFVLRPASIAKAQFFLVPSACFPSAAVNKYRSVILMLSIGLSARRKACCVE